MWESLACRLGGLWAPPRPAVPTLAPLMLIPGAHSGAHCEEAGDPGPRRHRQYPDDAVRRGKLASNVPTRESAPDSLLFHRQDTRIREDADPDCLHLFAREFELHQDIGLLQIMTLGHAMEPTFWSRYAVVRDSPPLRRRLATF